MNRIPHLAYTDFGELGLEIRLHDLPFEEFYLHQLTNTLNPKQLDDYVAAITEKYREQYRIVFDWDKEHSLLLNAISLGENKYLAFDEELSGASDDVTPREAIMLAEALNGYFRMYGFDFPCIEFEKDVYGFAISFSDRENDLLIEHYAKFAGSEMPMQHIIQQFLGSRYQRRYQSYSEPHLPFAGFTIFEHGARVMYENGAYVAKDIKNPRAILDLFDITARVVNVARNKLAHENLGK